MSINTEKVKDTLEILVLVQFHQDNGTVYQGDFKGIFKRLPNAELDEMADAEPPLLNSEVVSRVLVGVKGIAKGEAEMPSDEALAWVKATPECVNAAVAAFFKSVRPERYNEKTSRKQRRV